MDILNNFFFVVMWKGWYFVLYVIGKNVRIVGKFWWYFIFIYMKCDSNGVGWYGFNIIGKRVNFYNGV